MCVCVRACACVSNVYNWKKTFLFFEWRTLISIYILFIVYDYHRLKHETLDCKRKPTKKPANFLLFVFFYLLLLSCLLFIWQKNQIYTLLSTNNLSRSMQTDSSSLDTLKDSLSRAVDADYNVKSLFFDCLFKQKKILPSALHHLGHRSRNRFGYYFSIGKNSNYTRSITGTNRRRRTRKKAALTI